MVTNISVVITAYNLSNKIGICLKELQQQTFREFDIIIVDDCSTDDTRAVIDALKPLFGERLKTIYCSQNNGSPGKTRNIALDSGLITGEYIIFLDGDDNIEPDFLEKMYKKACAEDADIVCCGYNRVNISNGNKEYCKEMCSFYTDQITRSSGIEYIPMINGSLWNKLIRMSCIGSKRIPDIKVGEDAAFLLNIYMDANRNVKIVFLSDILIHYNVYEKSLMSSIPKEEIIKLSDEFVRLYSLADEEYKNIVVFSVFIHIGISACVRAYQSKEIDTHEHLVWTKEYLDRNFPDWSKSKYLKFSNLRKLGIKGIAIKVCIWLYKLGMFRLFLFPYNFMITKIGKDVKWGGNRCHTFVICAYGESPYLEEAIKSILNQTIDSEVLIATGTPNNYIREIAKKYDICLLVNPNDDAATISGDWNFALKSAKTELVTLAHQDDYYEPQYAQTVLERAARHNPIIVFTEYYELRNGKKVYSNRLLKIKRLMNIGFRMFPRSRFMRKRVLSFGCSICCPAVTFNMKNCKDFKFDNNYSNNLDWDAWIRLSEHKGEFICINRPLMAHRIHESSSTTKNLSSSVRHNETVDIFKRFWPEWFAKRIIKLYEISDKSNDL